MESSSPSRTDRALARYAAWITRFHLVVLGLGLAILAAVVTLAIVAGLPLRSDLSSLLPPSAKSVQDLEVLKHRSRSFGNVLVMLEAPTAAVREAAAVELEAKLRAFDHQAISAVSIDDGATARFIWAHRFVFASVDDLQTARDALAEKLRVARLKANPLYIDLDDPAPAATGPDQLASLMKRLDDAQAKASAPTGRISPDGRAQLFTMQVTFPASNTKLGHRVIAGVKRIAREVERAHPGTVISLAGNVNANIFEHDSVVSGMFGAAVITLVLCGLALLLYYRAFFAVGALMSSLFVGVAGTFIFTKLAIGHLNIMSAFLAAIVVGNGINAGLVILARYYEEVRAAPVHSRETALAAIGPALVGAIPGTLAATLTATLAYGSLIITDFRGFRHFGAIGGVGMLLCWISAVTVLPAGLAMLAKRGLIRRTESPWLGEWLARLFPRSVGTVIAAGALITAAAIVIATVYVARDPFAKDWRALESDSADIRAQKLVDKRMRDHFEGGVLGGHSFQLALAVTDRAQVPSLVQAIRAVDADRTGDARLFTEVLSIDDLVPRDQPRKIAVLGEIRALLADPAITALPADERAKLERLRPPATIAPLTEADVAPDILAPFVEQDGSTGKLIFLKGSRRFRTWNVEDRVEFAKEVRQIELPPGAIIGGEPLVIADIVYAMKRDAPPMIAFSLLGSILAVFLVVGFRRHGVVTIVCALAGVVLMIAACALIGLPVHFLDLIALPISIGIGIDYAVNLAARDREEGERGPRHLLATTGGAVLLCSFTTTVGYGSLLLSANRGIRAFGTAAILGELACIAMALLLAPALLAWIRARPRR